MLCLLVFITMSKKFISGCHKRSKAKNCKFFSGILYRPSLEKKKLVCNCLRFLLFVNLAIPCVRLNRSIRSPIVLDKLKSLFVRPD